MSDLPSSITTATVTWDVQTLAAAAGGLSVSDMADGTITFTWPMDALRVPGADPKLVIPLAALDDIPITQGTQTLIRTDCTALARQGWAYTATWALPGGLAVASVQFTLDSTTLDADGNLDLSSIEPSATLPNVTIMQGPAGVNAPASSVPDGYLATSDGSGGVAYVDGSGIYVPIDATYLGIDTDGVPYFNPDGVTLSSVARLEIDTDGVPYFTTIGS